LSDVVLHHDLVAATITAAVDKIAICADTGVLALGCVALVALTVPVAERVATPFASNFAQTVTLDAFTLLAHAITVALECLALDTALQIVRAEKTTIRVVELTKGVQEDAIRHDFKSVPGRQQVENQDPPIITYFIIISKSIFKIHIT
jgi:hypothetical protein